MKVKALQKYYYAGREYQPGDSFEMDDRDDIRVLCDLGQLERVSEVADEAPPPPPPPKEEPPSAKEEPAEVPAEYDVLKE